MQSYKPRKLSTSKTEIKPEERVYFDTKYGPISIHQNGNFAKDLAATSNNSTESAKLYNVENVRVSLHLERFEGTEPFFQEIVCLANLPELGIQLRHQLVCQMKAGQTHGAGAFQSTYIGVDMKGLSNTVIEFEFFQEEKSLLRLALPLRVPTEKNLNQ